MALAKSVTFETDKDSLFATAIQIVQRAGYIISETDDAARKIIYYVDKPRGFLQASRRFEVTITVSGASQTAATTAMLSMKTIGITMIKLENSHELASDSVFEGAVINFVMGELCKHYQTVVTAIQNTNAPGAGGPKTGCLALFSFLGLLAASGGFGIFMLLATLFP